MKKKIRKTIFIDQSGHILKIFRTDQAFTPMHEGEKVTLNGKKWVIASIEHIPDLIERQVVVIPKIFA